MKATRILQRNLQKEFEEDTGYVFGRLPFDAFVGIKFTNEDEQEQELTKEQSESIWQHFKAQKYIADDGTILDEVWYCGRGFDL